MSDRPKRQIVRFTLGELRSGFPAIPGLEQWVDRGRLASQFDNPHATESDVVLTVATANDRAVGTLGAIPARLPDAAQPRFAWLHNWAAAPTERGVGGQLLLTIARCFDDRIAVSGCTSVAERIYLASRKLVMFRETNGFSGYRRITPEMLRSKLGTWRIAVALAAGVADVHHRVQRLRERMWRRRAARLTAGMTVRVLPQLSPAALNCIEAEGKHDVFRRTGTELNWIARFTGPQEHQTFFLEIGEAQRVIGVAMLTRQGRRMRIPYVFCPADRLKILTAAIGHHMAGTAVDEVLSYSAEFWHAMDEIRFPLSLRRKQRFVFLVAPTMRPLGNEDGQIHDGDGDGFV